MPWNSAERGGSQTAHVLRYKQWLVGEESISSGRGQVLHPRITFPILPSSPNAWIHWTNRTDRAQFMGCPCRQFPSRPTRSFLARHLATLAKIDSFRMGHPHQNGLAVHLPLGKSMIVHVWFFLCFSPSDCTVIVVWVVGPCRFLLISGGCLQKILFSPVVGGLMKGCPHPTTNRRTITYGMPNHSSVLPKRTWMDDEGLRMFTGVLYFYFLSFNIKMRLPRKLLKPLDHTPNSPSKTIKKGCFPDFKGEICRKTLKPPS